MVSFTQLPNGCIYGIHVQYPDPMNEPNEVAITAEQAIALALSAKKAVRDTPKVELMYMYVGITPAILGLQLSYKVTFDNWVIRINAVTGKISGVLSQDGYNYSQSPCTPNIDAPNYSVPELWYGDDLAHFTTHPDDRDIHIRSCDFGPCELYDLYQNNTDNNIQAYWSNAASLATVDSGSPRHYVWAADHKEATPMLWLSGTLPSDATATNGTMSLQVSDPTPAAPANTYIATFAGNASGIFSIPIEDNEGCAYTEPTILGTQDADYTVTANATQPTCYSYGNIVLNIPGGGSGATVKIAGPVNSANFNGLSLEPYGAPENFDIAAMLNGSVGLPPGDYAILVIRGGKHKALNVRLDFPNCDQQLKALQSAYWAVEHTQQFFKHPSINSIYDADKFGYSGARICPCH
ncbi:MAG: hypothetical protein IPL33_16835 [Sphingobacteriales bacterium]|nr:hypothetical protein [Sphingobacteriales bacterium]